MKTIQLFLFSLFLGSTLGLRAQQLKWDAHLSGPSVSTSTTNHSNASLNVTATAIDNLGNTYVGGDFKGAVDMDPSGGTFWLTSTVGYDGFNHRDAFVAKYDPNGALIWAYKFGGNQNEYISDIELTSTGDLIILGRYGGTVDFDFGPAAYNLVEMGSSEGFVLSITSSGGFNWVKRIGLANLASPPIPVSYVNTHKLFIKPNNEIIVAGNWTGFFGYDSQVLFAIHSQSAIVNTDQNGFVLFLNTDGTLQKFVSLDPYYDPMFTYTLTPTMTFTGIDADSKGDLYISGYCKGSYDFAPGNNQTDISSSQLNNGFIWKLNANGNYRAKWILYSYSHELTRDLQISGDKVHIIGYFHGDSMDIDPSPAKHMLYKNTYSDFDGYLTVVDTSGSFLWGSHYAAMSYSRCEPTNLVIDSDGGIYVAGYFTSLLDLDPDSTNTFSVTAITGATNSFVQKLDNIGQFVWGGSLNSFEYSNIQDVALSSDLNPVLNLVGTFTLDIDLDPFLGLSYKSMTGRSDGFITQIENVKPAPLAVSTAYYQYVGADSAYAGGSANSEGSSAILAKGLCWNTSTQPTLAHSFSVEGTGLGSFNAVLSPLQSNTTYYYRAYAYNSSDTAYGDEFSFTTSSSCNFMTISQITKVGNPNTYSVQFANSTGNSFALQTKLSSDTVWNTTATWTNASLNQRNFQALGYNESIDLRLGAFDGSTWTYGCSSSFTSDCKPMSVNAIELVAPFCEADSALLKATFTGGYRAKTFLWNTGQTTRFIYGRQGIEYTVVVTDEAGCQDSASVTIAYFNRDNTPAGFSLSKDNATTFTGNWAMPTLMPGVSLIGYRMAYRQANVGGPWSYTPLSLNQTATVDFTGSGLPSGNYEFAAFARVNDNGTILNSGFTCKERKFYNGIGAKNDGASIASSNPLAYPNPFKHSITLEINYDSTIRISDALGRIILETTMNAGSHVLNTADWANGVYILEVIGEENQNIRIIKD